MYYLKLTKYKRTEISRYIFSYEMLNKLEELFEMIFTLYQNNLKESHVSTSHWSYTYAIETLIMLFLETKDDMLSKMIERVFSSDYSVHNNNNHFPKLVRLFRNNQIPIVNQTIKASGRSLEAQHKFREKVAIKMNEMKNKQADILKKTLTNQTIQQEDYPN